MVRPEQSKEDGPAAAHTYGLPSCCSAQLAAASPALADAPAAVPEAYAPAGAVVPALAALAAAAAATAPPAASSSALRLARAAASRRTSKVLCARREPR